MRHLRTFLAGLATAAVASSSLVNAWAQTEDEGGFQPVIDLPALYDAGTLTVDTDMTWGEPVRERNALDVDALNGVVRDSATPPDAYYQIDFDEPLTILAMGITLKPTFPESAVVEITTDGDTWTTVATYDAVDTGRVLDWTYLDGELEITRVRVRITDSFGQWPVLEKIALANELPTDPPTTGDITVAQAAPDKRLFFPDIITLDDGRLLAAYYEADSHLGPQGRILATDSSDGGHNWSEPWVVVESPHDDRDPKLAQLSDGTILLSFFQTDWSESPATIRGAHVVRSEDSGFTWTEPIKVGSAMDCSCGTPIGSYWSGFNASHGAVVELPGGDLLMPIYGVLPDEQLGQATVVRSRDGGRTWPAESEVTIAAPDPGQTLIDLPAMYDAGTLSVETDMTWGDPVRQRNVLDVTAPNGVVRDSAAPPEARYTIDFASPLTIRAVGVTLKPTFPESAVVEISTDGNTWTTVATYDAEDTGSTLDWTTLDEEVEISRFRVRITDSHGQWPVLERIALADEPVMERDAFSFQEPTLAVLDSGEIVALLRTTTSPQVAYLSRSFDGGLTWSKAEPTDIPASSHHLLPLTGGGILVTYGDVSGRFSPRRATTGRIVDDPSGSWNGYHDIPLYDSGHADQANPSSTEVVPGLFLTLSFDYNNRTVVGVFSARDHYWACTSRVTGEHAGPLTIDEGTACLDGATIEGPVRMAAGTALVVRGSRINGPLSAKRPTGIAMCDTDVSGPVRIAEGRSVVLGNPDAGCEPIQVAGPVTVSDTAGATLIAGNTVPGKLSCSGNDPAPSNAGHPNVVGGPATGQCANL